MKKVYELRVFNKESKKWELWSKYCYREMAYAVGSKMMHNDNYVRRLYNAYAVKEVLE